MGTAALTDQWLLLDSAQGDPFAQLDEFLAWHGFGVWSEPFVPAADGLVADLYLGYGLAAALPGVNSRCRRSRVRCRAGLPLALGVGWP